MSEILQDEFAVPEEVAEQVADSFLREFRCCPENPGLSLDEWRMMLWSEALGPRYEYLAEVVYSRWRKLRYKHMAISQGVAGMLNQLRRRRLRLALVTNGPSNSQWEKVNELGLARFFHIILVSGDLPWEKPQPQIFLHACQLLGVPPSECMVVGDRPETDLLGGRKAGLAAVAWVPLNPATQATQQVRPTPDFVLGHVEDLLDALPSCSAISSAAEEKGGSQVAGLSNKVDKCS